ncbi:Stp1/IreP family PP2C-type Ser/Thr phosphatase [Alkalicoccus luteus]|uniref:Stp1/IreP family PP2C-type Ser/Thr phosphatase n=1 Tax=Alkalicoccus luteus TaxID=1237094 RepID=A0A969PN15_9BACI|nr:Stp1/IreP family PP2C-type Ser/Thr phosphatase [Alkalicoccus luteus]
MIYSIHSDTGKVRSHNEDSVLFHERSGWFLTVVADGMGGHQAGDVASRMACNRMLDQFKSAADALDTETIEEWLRKTVDRINSDLFTYQQEHLDCRGMGTTLTAAVGRGEDVYYINVGDSRLYLLTGNAVTQITKDQSLVGELVRQGELTEAEAEVHPRRNVLLQALGTEMDVSGEIGSIRWRPEDTLLLCTDGLTNKLADSLIMEIVHNETSLEDAGERLIASANDKGGEDNITAALVRFHNQDGGAL